MPSLVLDTLRQALARTFNVPYVPPLDIYPGIAPTVVMGAQNPLGCIFRPENCSYAIAVPVSASTNYATTGDLPVGAYDIDYCISASGVATNRYVAVQVVDATDTLVFSRWFTVMTSGMEGCEGCICVDLTQPNWEVRIRTGGGAWVATEVLNASLIWRRRSVS